MQIEESVSKWFHLDDETWMKHANPWSVYTRYSVLPILIFALRSRIWIGGRAIVPILFSLARMFYNPHAFPQPLTTKNRASKAVFGERVWINRKKVPIPKHHTNAIIILNSISAVGTIFVVRGLISVSPGPTILGTILVLAFKSRFLDRMVRLYEDMKDQDTEYQSREY